MQKFDLIYFKIWFTLIFIFAGYFFFDIEYDHA